MYEIKNQFGNYIITTTGDVVFEPTGEILENIAKLDLPMWDDVEKYIFDKYMNDNDFIKTFKNSVKI